MESDKNPRQTRPPEDSMERLVLSVTWEAEMTTEEVLKKLREDLEKLKDTKDLDGKLQALLDKTRGGKKCFT